MPEEFNAQAIQTDADLKNVYFHNITLRFSFN